MNKMRHLIAMLTISCAFLSCGNSKDTERKDLSAYEKGTFGYDLNFLLQKDSLIVLTSPDEQAQVIVSAKYQAKVFTSTARGYSGKSIGFVNYKALDSETIDEHMNGYGGENRFWLGPEGGRYSVFFKNGKEQSFSNWHTPKPIDIEPWALVSADKKQATMTKEIQVSNYLGTNFKLNVDRKIELLDSEQSCRLLGIAKNDHISSVAYTTENTITNLNDYEWTDKTGTICIWMLDMFIPGVKALTFIPFYEGDEDELGKIVTSDYFGEIPDDRLVIKDNMVYLKTDGKYRSKLGLNNKRTKAMAGNYDPDSKRLTVVTYDVDKNAIYLNQEWNISKDPLVGDAMNAYNDGPLDDGSIIGPLLELESTSPAAFLKPNQKLSHKHTVFHFVGDEKDLTTITAKLFGVSLDEIKDVF